MDPQTLLVRRVVAGVIAFLVLILLVFGIRGCLNARKEQAFRDYVRDVTALVEESNQQSQQLFGVFRDRRGRSNVDLQNTVNGFRVQAAQLVDRARDTEHPDELRRAQRFLVQTLEFRRDGVARIADELPTALGDEGARARGRIAAQMQSFLTSDVVYSQRVIPALEGPLREESLLDQVRVPKSQFLPAIDFLRPETVSDRISRISGTEDGEDDEAATPGLHGLGLIGVTVKPGGQALTEGQPVSVRGTEDLTFDVRVQNQGENPEEDVTVRIAITGGPNPIEVEEQLDEIAAGEQKTVSIPLADTPPMGRQVTIEVEVRPVPGEKKTDNNEGSFPATFTAG